MNAKTERNNVLAMDFEEFAAKHQAPRADIGDAGVHKRGRNQSDKQWRRIIAQVEKQTSDILARREALREEYQAAVSRGEIRPLTRIERIQRAAAGHPDLESTAAAKRLLIKHGYASVSAIDRVQPASEPYIGADPGIEVGATCHGGEK